MDVHLLVSVILGVLLVAMIASAWRLSQRIDILRDANGEMKALIDGLNAATERAHAGISQLRAASQQIQENLGTETKKARALADELALITSAGDDLASRLEARLTAAPSKLAEQAARQPVSLAGQAPSAPRKTHQNLMQVLRGVR